jgi:hypothetical protein
LHRSSDIEEWLKGQKGRKNREGLLFRLWGKTFHRSPLAALFGSLWNWNRNCVSLSFTAPTPGHLFQRLEKVNKLPIRKRTERPGVIGANKAPAVRNQAVHGFSNGRMIVSAGVNAIVFGKTGNVRDFWCIWGHTVGPDYTPNQGAI